jgi:hypothetical protein
VLNAIALVVLAGMMFIPIINVVVGIVGGAAMLGLPDGFVGAALAILITTGELVPTMRLRPKTAPLVHLLGWSRAQVARGAAPTAGFISIVGDDHV